MVFHRYYRCSEWDTNHIQFSDDGVNLGSLRTGNSYCLAPPSKHDETRERYTVSDDRQIRSVSVGSLESVVSELKSQHQPAAAAAGVGSASQTDREGTDESIPSEYPNRDRSFSECKQILSQNDLLEKLNRTSSSDWSGTEFVLCKCLAEQGTSVDSIYDTLSRLHRSAKWHNGSSSLSVSEYRSLTVQKAIEKACTDPYVEFDTADMEASEASERRKTESGDGTTGPIGGDSRMEYNTIESLTVYNADSPEKADDGDRVVRVELTNMNGQGDDGEPVDTDFVTVTKGTLRENGDFGVAPEFPGQSKSVGSADPDDLRLIAEGLEEIAEQLDE